MPETTQLRAVRQLLSIVVDSFEKLEIVMHLHRVPFAAQTTDAIAQTLSLSAETTAEALAELANAGVVRTKEHDGWWFDPSSSWASSVDALVTIYQADRIEVVKLMSHMAMERARSSVAQRFADAFVLRPTKTKRKPDA